MKHLALTLVLVSCAGTPGAAPANSTQAEPAVELAEITVYDGDAAMLKFHADGTTELGGHSGRAALTPGRTFSTDSLPVTWKRGPVIRADGSIEHDGVARVRINADGTITDLVKAVPLPLTIADDKAMLEPGKGLALAANGTLTIIGGRPDKVIHVVGADTPPKRRLVLAFMAMMFMGKAQVQPPEITTTTITTTTTDD